MEYSEQPIDGPSSDSELSELYSHQSSRYRRSYDRYYRWMEYFDDTVPMKPAGRVVKIAAMSFLNRRLESVGNNAHEYELKAMGAQLINECTTMLREPGTD